MTLPPIAIKYIVAAGAVLFGLAALTLTRKKADDPAPKPADKSPGDGVTVVNNFGKDVADNVRDPKGEKKPDAAKPDADKPGDDKAK